VSVVNSTEVSVVASTEVSVSVVNSTDVSVPVAVVTSAIEPTGPTTQKYRARRGLLPFCIALRLDLSEAKIVFSRKEERYRRFPPPVITCSLAIYMAENYRTPCSNISVLSRKGQRSLFLRVSGYARFPRARPYPSSVPNPTNNS
jgi:hypothetical protein